MPAGMKARSENWANSHGQEKREALGDRVGSMVESIPRHLCQDLGTGDQVARNIPDGYATFLLEWPDRIRRGKREDTVRTSLR